MVSTAALSAAFTADLTCGTQATADSTALLTLRGLACALGGITAGLLLAGVRCSPLSYLEDHS